jgi:hypothetical protein
MQTVESRIEIAKELFIPNKQLFLPEIDLSKQGVLVGLAGSWVGTRSDTDLTPRYGDSKKIESPDFRIILLGEIEPRQVEIEISGIPTRAYIRSLRSQTELVQSAKIELYAKYLRLYDEIEVFEEVDDELGTLKREASHLLHGKPLKRHEHIDAKSKVKIYIEDALSKLNQHLDGNKRDFNEINGFLDTNKIILNLFLILNKWIPRKRNINNYLLEKIDRKFGENWIKINQFDSETGQYFLPINERIELLRDNYELMFNWAKASQPL